MYWRRLSFRLLSLLIAANYFAFRVECFEGESEQHGPRPQGTVAFNTPSTDWETFDKNNAPEAVTVEVSLRIEFCIPMHQECTKRVQHYPPFQLIRDKSPPLPSLTTQG